MDINLLLLIAALILGLIIGWILARNQSGGLISELESRVQTAQTAAENAKRDFANVQSELAVKDSHINTLNANIGILEEKLRLAEQGREEFTTTITRLQDELRAATTDRPALEAELRQRDAELNELKAQLAEAQSEVVELRARIEAAETEREIATLRAQFAAETVEDDTAQFQATLTTSAIAAQAVEVEAEESTSAEEEAAPPEGAPSGDEASQASVAELESRAAELQKEVLSLRDGLATLAFAGAELVAEYERRTKEYEDQLVRLQQAPPASISVTTGEGRGVGPVGAMGLVAGGAALAGGLQEGQPAQPQVQELQSQLAALRAELDAVVASKVELETQLESRTAELGDLQKQYDALRADLQTETSSRAEIASLLQTREVDLSGLKDKLSKLDAELDEIIASAPDLLPDISAGVATNGQSESSAQPLDTLAKFAVVKGLIGAFATRRSELEGQLQARESELNETKQQFAALQTDIDTLFAEDTGEVSQTLARIGEELPEELPADPRARLALLKERLEAEGMKLADVEAGVDALLGGEIEVPEGEAPLDLKGKIELLKARFGSLEQGRAELAAKLEAEGMKLADVEAGVDALLGGEIEVPEGEAPLDLKGKLELIKARFGSLEQGRAELAAKLDAEGVKLADVEAGVDALLGGEIEVPEGEAPLDLKGKLELLKARFGSLEQGRAELAAKLEAEGMKLADVEAGVDALLGGEIEVPEGEAPLDLKGKLELIKARFGSLEQGRAELAAKLEAEGVKLADIEAGVDALLGGEIEVPEGEAPLDLKGKLELLKARFGNLEQGRAELAAKLEAEGVKLADVEADINAWLLTQVEVPEAEMPADLKSKLVLFKSSFRGLKQAKEGAEARLQEKEAEFAALSEQLTQVRGELEIATQARADLDIKLQEKEAELARLNEQLAQAQGELEFANQARADLVAQIESLSAAKSGLEAQLGEINKRVQRLEEEVQDAGRRSTLGPAAIVAGATTAGVVAASRPGEEGGEAREAAGEAAAADLMTQLEVKDAEIADLNARLEAMKNVLQARDAEFGELQARLAELTAAEEGGQVDLREQVSALQVQLDEVTAERDALKAELEARAQTIAPAGTTSAEEERLTLVRQYVKETKEAAIRAATEAGREVRTAECPQDLAMTKGIGSVFEQRLYAAGIGTFWELANLTDDDFRRILDLDDRQLLRVDFEAIRADARRLAIETDSVGRVWQGAEPDDFEPLEGIGNVYERRLYEAGICTFEALANATVEQLMEICPPTKLRKPNYADWIAQARIMAQKKQRGA